MKHIKEFSLYLQERSNDQLKKELIELAEYLKTVHKTETETKYQFKNFLIDVQRMSNLSSFVYNLLPNEPPSKSHEPEKQKKLLTAEEVRDIYNFKSVQSIYNMVKNKKLTAEPIDTINSKSGRKYLRFKASEVEKHL